MKILVVDDHPIVRAGLRRLLADEECDFREAASGREALAIFREHRPDVVVLDLSMPGGGGLEVIGRFRVENAAVRILVLSMHQDAVYARRALQAGATGFISKSAPPERLLEAIKEVAAGHGYIEHQIAQELAFSNIRAGRSLLDELSSRELEILRLLGEGNSLGQIAEAIGVSYKTVANTCSQIKGKLGVARTADLVRLAIQGELTSR